MVTEFGPGAFSARAVATRAQLPLAAVSYYFPHLDDLLGAAIVKVLQGWLDHGLQVIAAIQGTGVDVAADAITAALLPPGPAVAVRIRYQHLLAAAGHPVAVAAVADLRPSLRALVGATLTATDTRSRLSADAIVALLDGAAVGAVSEGAPDPRQRVTHALLDVLESA